MENNLNVLSFDDMDLSVPVVSALRDLGWDVPTPIQAATIPCMMNGMDVVGLAQTGTGKTAAFALPILSNIDLASHDTQVLVLTPTRELCIQVATVFGQLASGMRGIRVLPVYGGQGFSEQLCALKKGVHIIVGTPGRVMDHMRRNTLKLDSLRYLVLDEADEMLNMGFAEDIEWILQQTPTERQTALFSATMPPEIRRIAMNYLKSPEEITIRNATATADNITHRFWVTQNWNKFEALTRILESEEHDGVLIFARTKSGTIELADGLTEAGMPAGALNGDMKQADRERMVNRFKEGRMDILVATDVAARGLDVDRISHVVNYDPPHDVEGYVHRVGRTGRAGRSGHAIMIATPRERRFLAEIERATRQAMEPYVMPTLESLNRKRIEHFKTRLAAAVEQDGAEAFDGIICEFVEETGVSATTLAAALAKLMHGNTPLLADRMPEPAGAPKSTAPRSYGSQRGYGASRPTDAHRLSAAHGSSAAHVSSAVRDVMPSREPRPFRKPESPREPEPGMDRYRIECGHQHGVMPGNIVGAIANEAGLRGKDIGHIDIFDEYSTVDLPAGMPDRVFSVLRKTKVGNRYLNLSLLIQSKLERHEARGEERGDRGGMRRPTRSSGRPAPHSPRTGRRRDS